ncbi:MAG: DUF3098 domain-containing protein [Candidatus Amulumruptor caecigallinarius]|nr:DUF3098 domain-containing protein [Candidatus Amulumruptor caecigallinarius]MCM1396923.1 DUF3098 domain-containing protein [Candidatus Amulumruptor caecigallinarius]MCM1454133.1 DUF3098 domain-containing protein [bacterium]
MAKTATNSAETPTTGGFVPETAAELPLVKRNFVWMGIAALMIVAGFLLMLGDSSTSESFNPDIFSTRRVAVGPTVAFAGYVVMAVAILLKPRRKEDESTETLTEGKEAADGHA